MTWLHNLGSEADCIVQAIFNDPDWYTERMEGDADDEALQPLVVDLQHLNSELVEIAIADLYTENAAERLHSRSKW